MSSPLQHPHERPFGRREMLLLILLVTSSGCLVEGFQSQLPTLRSSLTSSAAITKPHGHFRTTYNSHNNNVHWIPSTPRHFRHASATNLAMTADATAMNNDPLNRRPGRRRRQLRLRASQWKQQWNLIQKQSKSQDSKKTTKPTAAESHQIQLATFNLIKATAGSGLLALPSGLAAMSDHRTSLIPAISLISIIGIFSGYTFGLYGRLIHSNQAKSLGEIWEHEKGKSTSWIISLATSTFCFGAALSFSMIIGDTFQNLARAMEWNGIARLRSFWILLSTSTVLWPLCNMKSLASLAPVSILGVLSVLATVGFLGWRCPLLSSASPYAAMANGGGFLSTLMPHQLPQFNTFSHGLLSSSSLILVGMAATAFLGHCSAADIYHSLAGKNAEHDSKNSAQFNTMEEGSRLRTVTPDVMGQNSTTDLHTTTEAATTMTIAKSTTSVATAAVIPLPKASVLKNFLKVVSAGFVSVTVLNCLTLAFGFSTFGGNSNGIILNNFSTFDNWATVCRLLMAICVIGGYPFCVGACRTEALDIWKTLKLRQQRRRLLSSSTINNNNNNNNSLQVETATTSPREKKMFTFGLLSALAGLAIVLKDAGFVVAFNGAVAGSAIGYIFPSMLFLEHTKSTTGAMMSSPRLKLERWFCRFLIGFGVLAAVAGGGVSILNTYFPHLL